MAEGKEIAVKVPGAEGSELKDTNILPGTKPEDVLEEVGFASGYELADENSNVYERGSNFYQQVQSGGKVYVVRAAEVGSPAPLGLLLFFLFFVAIAHLAKEEDKRKPRHRSERRTKKEKPIVIGPKPRRRKQKTACRKKASVLRPRGSCVRRSNEPWWKERGWRKKNGRLLGYFKTPYGRYPGQVVLKAYPDFYIKNPPLELKLHEKGDCFSNHVGKGWFWIHFAKNPGDPSSGIIKIEQVLREAQQKARGGIKI